MAYMVAAYLIIWVAAFAFIFSMVQRQRTLQREIEALQELVKERGREEIRSDVTMTSGARLTK